MTLKFVQDTSILDAEQMYRINIVNCRNIFDKKVRNKFPIVYQEYRKLFLNADLELCDSYMGKIHPIFVGGDKGWVINVFAEQFPYLIKFSAFEQCLNKVKNYILKESPVLFHELAIEVNPMHREFYKHVFKRIFEDTDFEIYIYDKFLDDSSN